MSLTVGIRELRQQASALLKRVACGEVINVTDHGHPIARIVPFRPASMERLVLEGRATEPVGDLVDLADVMDLPVSAAGPVLPSAALDELRSGER